MKYMVVETFRQGAEPVYARFAERGRMLPDGLTYVDSWIDANQPTRCFQLMETEDEATLATWMAEWEDLVTFEVVPVITSAEAAARRSKPVHDA